MSSFLSRIAYKVSSSDMGDLSALICGRFASWKQCFFSQAGRLTLIKAVLSGVPMYYFSLFRIPGLVCKSLEKYIRDFMWNGIYEGTSSHLVSREK